MTTADALTFHTPGRAVQQGSKKHVGGGRYIEAAKHLPTWRKAVIAAAKSAAGTDWQPLDGALACTLEIRFDKPATTKFKDYPAGAPDLDKLQRAIGDALTQAHAIHDDARIVDWIAAKRWATTSRPAGAYITIARKARP